MGLLDSIQTGKSSAPRRTMVYGVHGVGKSSFGAAAPKPVFLPTEEGLGEIDCAKFPLAKTFAEAFQWLAALYTDPHEYRTLVVDTLDWLERLIWAHVCKEKRVQNLEEIGYGKGYVFAIDSWQIFLDGLDALRRERGMGIVLLAHARIERFENPETDSYDRYVPRLHKLASHLIQEWCDEVLFATYKVYTTTSDEGFNRKKIKGIGAGERVVYTTERPAHVAKNRLRLPNELPLDWSAYATHFSQPA